MKTLATAIISTIALSMSLWSCSNARALNYKDAEKLNTYEIKIDKSFNALSVANNFDVEYTVGPKVSITLRTEKENYENVKIFVENHTLTMLVENNNKFGVNRSHKAEVIITAPAVTSITATNNCDIDIIGQYDINNLTVSAMNNAEIDFKNVVKTAGVNINALNNADVEFSGLTAEKAEFTSTNNAEITVKDIQAKDIVAKATNNAELTLSGRCDDAVLTATNNAEIDAGRLIAKKAVCTAQNLATIVANSNNMVSTTHNKAQIKNKAK